MMIRPRMKCPCCGTTAGPWWIDAVDGLLCLACAAWVSGFYRLAFLCKTLNPSADMLRRVRAVCLSPWAPAPLNFSTAVH